MLESIGKRIASLRQSNGWTQQSLASRVAMSRVAISHIEMDLSIPSERTVILLAGLFKLSPHQLVEGTTYPRAKAERLPSLATSITQLELNHALLMNDLDWLECLNDQNLVRVYSQKIMEKWRPLIDQWSNQINDERELALLSRMQSALRALSDRVNHPRT